MTRNENLNERDYGDLTGLNKKETADKFGEEQVHKWRRGYSDQPPNGESLEDVVRRVKIYFEESINPAIHSADNNNILIAAHGNSLRALLIVMNIYDSSNINSVELSTGVPIHVILENNKFKDIGNKDFDEPSRIRTIISADFDNDGFDEVFMNNIAEPNKLFRIKDNGKFEQINFQVGLEANGYGTGAAVADIDNDGILELLVSRGESKAQTLTLYKAKVDKGSKYLRIKPLNKYGAPARGATVTLITNQRKHSKTIDAGSGYLCQMEPVAHYGIRKNEKNFKVEIRWTNGSKEMIDINKLNQTIILRQK